MNRKQFFGIVYLGLATMIPLGIISSNPVNGQTGINLSTFRSTALSQHNTYRNTHNSPDMTLSDSLNDSAQNWADYLATNGVFEHSNSSGVGENIYVSYTTASSVDAANLANQAVTSWYNEVSDYDYANPGFSSETGHFTQVVWKNSTQLGCGEARGVETIQGNQYNAFYVVCQYAPAGNVMGQFPDNVMAP
ncbi:SCP-like extracellular protein, putative [Coleofasciculus chthonoplastes PCC 7420]|uniref:SCP-like extracellular protein, putative n=1 Tax=Coleofasciculus chthonoplastes PCC 7420 TaxID=118168 RepID=B4VHV1_9CYAN|nr:CAP family protein [Coleofasciculus chthonoplastes]EDX78347.1 SCP-like extracellular protein, putative [Coleofasciculus chthonoplastes PCC 7420]